VRRIANRASDIRVPPAFFTRSSGISIGPRSQQKPSSQASVCPSQGRGDACQVSHKRKRKHRAAPRGSEGVNSN
jgi:hypothetical protein